MAIVTRKFAPPKGIKNEQTYIFDFGEPEHLDGAMMQFVVHRKKRTERGKHRVESETVAYFRYIEDAVVFVDSMNEKVK